MCLSEGEDSKISKAKRMWCFWGTEKCPRWWQQGRRWSPRVRSGPSWAGTWPHVSLAQWPKQIKTKTNILSCLPTTGVERKLPHCSFRELGKTLCILSRRVSAQTPAPVPSPLPPPASGLRAHVCPPPPSSDPLVPGLLLTVKELLWDWVLECLAASLLNECVFLLCWERCLVFSFFFWQIEPWTPEKASGSSL